MKTTSALYDEIFPDIYSEFANVGFANERIELWDSEQFKSQLLPFTKEHYWWEGASINVLRVVGTQHPDYAGKTWLELLKFGKRMRSNLPLYSSNPGYYYEAKKKQPSMYYLSIDGGNLYVGDDGNHRTCIARFDFYLKGLTALHGVNVSDYRIDWEMKKLYDTLQTVTAKGGLPYRIEIMSKAISRDDSAGWKIDKYDLHLKVSDYKKNKIFLMPIHEAEDFLKNIEKKQPFKFW